MKTIIKKSIWKNATQSNFRISNTAAQHLGIAPQYGWVPAEEKAVAQPTTDRFGHKVMEQKYEFKDRMADSEPAVLVEEIGYANEKGMRLYKTLLKDGSLLVFAHNPDPKAAPYDKEKKGWFAGENIIKGGYSASIVVPMSERHRLLDVNQIHRDIEAAAVKKEEFRTRATAFHNYDSRKFEDKMAIVQAKYGNYDKNHNTNGIRISEDGSSFTYGKENQSGHSVCVQRSNVVENHGYTKTVGWDVKNERVYIPQSSKISGGSYPTDDLQKIGKIKMPEYEDPTPSMQFFRTIPQNIAPVKKVNESFADKAARINKLAKTEQSTVGYFKKNSSRSFSYIKKNGLFVTVNKRIGGGYTKTVGCEFNRDGSVCKVLGTKVHNMLFKNSLGAKNEYKASEALNIRQYKANFANNLTYDERTQINTGFGNVMLKIEQKFQS